ncbi:MAG: hypothetical protein ACREA0_34545, partial [bacterium]
MPLTVLQLRSAIVGLSLLLSAPVQAQEYPYALFELPPLDTELLGASAGAINEYGHLAGFALDPSGLHATRWENLIVFDLGTFGNDAWSAAKALN